jgi:hypothetical protein
MALLGGVLAVVLASQLMIAASMEGFPYESSDGGFHDFEMPAKGRTWEMVERFMSDYRSGHPDVVFYRTFERERGLRFWIWAGAFYEPGHPRWKLPYRPASSR